jgi:hypothetical protein
MAKVFIPNLEGWEALAKQVVEGEVTRRMRLVADACNAADGLVDGYRLGSEGDGPHLQKGDYRQTVITATAEAMVANAKHNTLEHNFHLASGAS